MDCYLFVDFGSTYTKLSLIDIEKEEVLARSRAFTTVETDVMESFDQGLAMLREKAGRDFNIKKVSSCSSAAGGLEMVALGLVPSLTAEAAKRAALGAGAKLTGVYTHELIKSDLEEILEKDPDIVLLAGGTDGGNQDTVIHNSRLLAEGGLRAPLVYAGNKSARDKIEKILKDRIDYYITDNVMPRINELNVEPCRESIRKIFMDRITEAKGMDRVNQRLGTISMPTPAAVLKACQVLSLGSENEEGLGDLALVDIGGATTDIHSIGKGWPSNPAVSLKGLEEPLAKRTVEGDLGMRYSAGHVAEDNEDIFKSYLSPSYSYDLDLELDKRKKDPGYLAKDVRDLSFDLALAKTCTRLAMTRHAGRVREVYSPIGPILQQTGKDLVEIPALIGTGGILTSTPYAKDILREGLYRIEETKSLKPRDPDLYIDETYTLSAMGLLAMIDEDMAVRMMKKNLKKV